MDFVKVTLCNRGMRVEAARQWAKDGKEWRALNESLFVTESLNGPFLLGPVFLRSTLVCSGGYRMVWGGMPLHDAIEIKCKTGQLLKIKANKIK